MIDLDELEKLAEAATPGPWEADDNRPFSRDLQGIFATDHKRYVLKVDFDQQPENMADAEFIAAANPQVVLALIERVRRVEAERDAALARIAELEVELAKVDKAFRSLKVSTGSTDARMTRAEARIAEAAKLHLSFTEPDGTFCKTCEWVEWPCPTAVALGLNEGEN